MSNGREICDGEIFLYFNGLRIISVEWLAGLRMAASLWPFAYDRICAFSPDRFKHRVGPASDFGAVMPAPTPCSGPSWPLR